MAASEGMNEMSTHTQSVRPFLVTCLDNYHDLLLLLYILGLRRTYIQMIDKLRAK